MRISVSEINPTTIKRYFSQRQNITTNYLRRKANDAKIDTNGLKWSEKAMVTANKWQGEHFNNAVTAIGTAGVAPIFIINNPLAKEDKATKKYTAARQPISAIITLAGQVPIMMAYNRMLDKYVTEHRLDRCDLHAAPPLSYYKDLVNSQTRKFLLENPELMGELSKDDIKYIKSLYYDKEKNNAFVRRGSFRRRGIYGLSRSAGMLRKRGLVVCGGGHDRRSGQPPQRHLRRLYGR